MLTATYPGYHLRKTKINGVFQDSQLWKFPEEKAAI